ncbi:MAG TPA: hypothetical protein VEA63_13025 [Opitutus sp.]|nr:hypothetical protein [Opitutus sp.]
MRTLTFIVLLAVLSAPFIAWAETSDSRVNRLETRVRKLERSGRSVVGIAFVAGVVAALWAQNTRRNAWLWFFAGVIFAPITLLVLLYLNAQDRDRDRDPPRRMNDRAG